MPILDHAPPSGVQNPFAALYEKLGNLTKERDALEAECADKAAQRSLISGEIENLKKERDRLRNDVHVETDNNRKAFSRSSSPAVSLGPSTSLGINAGSLHDFDEKGKLKRKVWLLESQLRDSEKEILEMKQAKEEAVHAEMAISQSLRDRIGRLEEKVRIAEAEVEEGKEYAERMKKEWEFENAKKASQQVSLKAQLEDVKEKLAIEREAREKLEEEISRLRRAKLDVEAELGLAKTRNEHFSVRSPLRVLQPQMANMSGPRSPATPSRSRSRPASHSPSPRMEHKVGSSLSIRFEAMSKQHDVLKKEYDKLRARYSDDLKHWKEYQVNETQRIADKKKRKAEKRAEKEAKREIKSAPPIRGLEQIEEATSTAEELVAASDASQAVSQLQSMEYESMEESVERRGPMIHARDVSVAPAPILPNREHPSMSARPSSSQRSRSNSTPNPYEHPTRSATPHVDAPYEDTVTTTPILQAHPRRNVPVPNRVTPWLGQHPNQSGPSSGKTPRQARELDMEDDDVFTELPAPTDMATPVAAHTPLVRDRTGGGETSLRKNTLSKTVSVSGLEHTGQTSMDASARKRKHVEMDNLTPTQKARERKKLANMTSKQKREYYAEYKGNGRYLPPEEVRLGVYEEFEVDPDQNEGENYQFHDVKRQKAERRLMHGGDCECCKDYYEAIGPIPKYNQGPRWKDPSQTDVGNGETSREAELSEHQNKVSRHRETWRRPKTPPGYWAIGFPTTQVVMQQNAEADQMVAQREAEVRREAERKDSKWRRKA